MEPITDQIMAPWRHILMYDDETVMSVAAELKAQKDPPQEWWLVVVDLGGGRYAVSPIGDLTERLKEGGAAFLQTPLSDLVGKTLTEVEVVADQDKDDAADVRRRTGESASHVAVIQKNGQFKGIVSVGGTRSGGTRGVMDTGLLGMAGKYAAIPDKGTLPISARRKRAKER